jgi:hypothetical protein
MTSLLAASPASVLEAMRGERRVRPFADTTAAAGLRATLEDAIFELLGATLLDAPFVLRASSLRRGEQIDTPSTSPLARVRGILIVQALRLMSVGFAVEHAFDEALIAWRAEVGANELTASIDHLTDEDAALLRSEVEAHCVTLKRSLGPIPTHWMPRTSQRAHQRLAGGNVVLRDVVDLMVGTTTSERASVALLDVTTSTLDEGEERAMRYHALVQTLRTGVVPLRTSAFSTATGELWSCDVDGELLTRSVADLLEVLRSKVAPS